MFVSVVVQVVLVVAGMFLIALPLVVGRDRLVAITPGSLAARARSAVPALVTLGVIMLLNRELRQVGPEFSWIAGWNATGTIYGIEGEFVAWLQEFTWEPLTTYFGYVYIHGYVFVLCFPVVIYALAEDDVPLRATLFAYASNYAIGVVCYLLIIAYGPRNIMPDLVEPLLYTAWPESQHLTRQVNRNTNVFPSLHTSLATTVFVLAYRTRTEFPRWLPIAAVLATSVIVATMYLGIHWAIDVLGGIALGLVSVAVAASIVHDEPTRQSRGKVTSFK